MSLKRQEREILDLWDRNFTIGQIAVQLGMTPTRVRRLINQLEGGAAQRVEREMMTSGSQALLCALRQAGACQ